MHGGATRRRRAQHAGARAWRPGRDPAPGARSKLTPDMVSRDKELERPWPTSLLSPDFATPPTARRRSRARAVPHRTTSSAMATRPSWRRGNPQMSCGWSCRAATATRATRRRRGLLAPWMAEGILRPDARAGVLRLRAAVQLGAGRRYTRRGLLRGGAARAVRDARRAAARAHAVGAQGGSPQADARDAHAALAGVRALPRRRAARRAPIIDAAASARARAGRHHPRRRPPSPVADHRGGGARRAGGAARATSRS